MPALAPYLSLGTETIDTLILQAPGQRYMRPDDQGIPTAAAPVTCTRFDFLAPGTLGATVLDTAYSDLNRDADGLARVLLTTAQGERRVTCGSINNIAS